MLISFKLLHLCLWCIKRKKNKRNYWNHVRYSHFISANLLMKKDTRESTRKLHIAHCRNVRALGRVSYINYIENLNILTEMLMNEKLANQV